MNNRSAGDEFNPSLALRGIVHRLNNVLTAMECLQDLAESGDRSPENAHQMRELLSELKSIARQMSDVDVATNAVRSS